METIEGNKLIAEFMELKESKGFTTSDSGILVSANGYEYRGEFTLLDELSYHSSWDWLMPVVEKIYYIVGIKSIDECDETEWYILKALFDLRITARIEKVWYSCVAFIKWYNDQKK